MNPFGPAMLFVQMEHVKQFVWKLMPLYSRRLTALMIVWSHRTHVPTGIFDGDAKNLKNSESEKNTKLLFFLIKIVTKCLS